MTDSKVDIEVEHLLFSILQEKIDKESLTKIGPLQWQQIDAKLSRNPACLVIFFFLKKEDLLGVLPEEVREKWQGFYYNNLKRNILALEQIVEIQNILKESGIDFILLKGASLISTVYRNLGLRSFADIDLLVKKEDLPALKYKLEELDYRLQSDKKASLLEKFGCGDWVFLKAGFLPLEIHWQLCQYERFRGIIKFNEQEIFRDAAQIEINNNRLLSLSKEDLFLYLSMHLGLVHGFSGFHWFYDLKAIIDYYRQDFDWSLLINKARKSNLTTVLYYILYFYKNLLDKDFPSQILKRIKPSFIKRKLIGLFIDERNIFRLDLSSKTGKTYYIVQGFLMVGLFNIIGVFVKMLFPSREWLLYRNSYRLQHIVNTVVN